MRNWFSCLNKALDLKKEKFDKVRELVTEAIWIEQFVAQHAKSEISLSHRCKRKGRVVGAAKGNNPSSANNQLK